MAEPDDDFDLGPPDIDVPMTHAEMAELFRKLGPSVPEDEPLSVDLDDYPLF